MNNKIDLGYRNPGSILWDRLFQAGDRIRTGDVQLGKLTFYH